MLSCDIQHIESIFNKYLDYKNGFLSKSNLIQEVDKKISDFLGFKDIDEDRWLLNESKIKRDEVVITFNDGIQAGNIESVIVKQKKIGRIIGKNRRSLLSTIYLNILY